MSLQVVLRRGDTQFKSIYGTIPITDEHEDEILSIFAQFPGLNLSTVFKDPDYVVVEGSEVSFIPHKSLGPAFTKDGKIALCQFGVEIFYFDTVKNVTLNLLSRNGKLICLYIIL